MRFLIYSTYNTSPHLDTELEIAKELLENGHEVFFLRCDKKFLTCFTNPSHNNLKCEYCQRMGRQGYKTLNIPSRNIIALPDIEVDYPQIERFKDLSELKMYKYKGADIGLAVTSSLVSIFRDHNFNTAQNQDFIDKGIKTGMYVYEAAKAVLQKIQPDAVYIFNGRFAESRPVLRLCEQMGIEYFTHERGGQLNRYLIRRNSTPHQLAIIHREIQEYWTKASANRIEIGNKFFVDRRNKVIQSWKVFTEDQKKGVLPSNLDTSKINIAIFNSSMDEYEGIADYRNKIYIDDNDGIARICESFIDKPSYHFFLRVHPNLKGLDNTQTKQIIELGKKYKNLTVIAAEEQIDSYSLMEAADTVVSFGSTMGIEALYWKKPSVLLGRAAYEDIKGLYKPLSHDEVVNLLSQKLTPQGDNEAIKFGYWCLQLGNEFKFYEPTGISTGKFMGKPLKLSISDRLRLKFLSVVFKKYKLG